LRKRPETLISARWFESRQTPTSARRSVGRPGGRFAHRASPYTLNPFPRLPSAGSVAPVRRGL